MREAKTKRGRRPKRVPEGDWLSRPLVSKLRAAREALDISLVDMARRLSYSKGHLSAVELGGEQPSVDLLSRYVRELQVVTLELQGRGKDVEQWVLGFLEHAPEEIMVWRRNRRGQRDEAETPGDESLRRAAGLGAPSLRLELKRTNKKRPLLARIERILAMGHSPQRQDLP